MNKIKYIIADDHAIFRQGVKYSISKDDELECVGEAENGRALLILLDKQPADVVLLDLKMPEMDGITACAEINRLFPETRIIILTMHDDEQYVIHMLDNGAHGYLVKNTDPKEIAAAIHSVYETGYYFSDKVSKIMLKALVSKKKVDPLFAKNEQLDERETDILKLICQELTTTEIAQKVFLSPRTVEGIRAGMLTKTGARNTAGLVLYAVKAGIIE